VRVEIEQPRHRLQLVFGIAGEIDPHKIGIDGDEPRRLI